VFKYFNKQRKDDEMTLEDKILEATLIAFNEQGAKFTLADVSKGIGISKKTIYTAFADKEALLSALIERGFAVLKEAEREIIESQELTTLEKISRIIIVIPKQYQQLDVKQFITLKEKYPKIYKDLQKHIESEWEPTLALIQKGIDEGCIREVPIPILKAVIEGSIEHFLDNDNLENQGYSYQQQLEGMMDLILQGIVQH
jgi:AcrR family transcriptional regulator